MTIPSLGMHDSRGCKTSPGSNSHYLESKAIMLLALVKDTMHYSEIYSRKLGLSTETWKKRTAVRIALKEWDHTARPDGLVPTLLIVVVMPELLKSFESPDQEQGMAAIQNARMGLSKMMETAKSGDTCKVTCRSLLRPT